MVRLVFYRGSCVAVVCVVCELGVTCVRSQETVCEVRKRAYLYMRQYMMGTWISENSPTLVCVGKVMLRWSAFNVMNSCMARDKT